MSRSSVGFFSGGGKSVAAAGTAAVQKLLKEFGVNGLSRGKTVDRNADGGAVGLPKNANTEEIAKFRGHLPHLPYG